MILRIKYRKTPEGRFLSHLDLVRTMQRAFRRAHLPLAYSEGFNPHPKLSYGSALAVGVTSEGEYLDVELRNDLSVLELKDRLKEAMPPGLEILEIKILGDRKESLTALINLARYQVEIPVTKAIDPDKLEQAAADILSREQLEVMRHGKKGLRSIDIRKGIYGLKASGSENKIVLEMDLQTGSEGNVRPEEVAEAVKNALGSDTYFGEGGLCVHRLGLFVRTEERIRTPLEA